MRPGQCWARSRNILPPGCGVRSLHGPEQPLGVPFLKAAGVLLAAALLSAPLPAGDQAVPAPRNTQPVCDGSRQKILARAPNGLLAETGEGGDRILVLHVWGAPYEIGLAQGRLLRKQLRAFLPDVVRRMTAAVEGGERVLDMVAEQSRPYWPPHFEAEMRGIADGAGLDLQTVIRANMIGEASEWHCSLFVASGPATRDGRLLQLRALDYETKAGIQRCPVLTIYHPGQGHPFVNIGWAGVIGAVTGVSSVPLAISEIGDDYDAEHDSFAGVPFMFLLRDILQFDGDLDAAVQRVRRVPRTTSLLYAVGDGRTGRFCALQTSRTLCNVFTPDNLEPLVPTHPRIPHIVYWGMSWNVPKYDQRLSTMLRKYYGRLTPEIVVRDILPAVETGSLQVAVYDLTARKVWVANAAAVDAGEKPPLQAWKRAYIVFPLDDLFRRKPPRL